jgi:hypothetical protein
MMILAWMSPFSRAHHAEAQHLVTYHIKYRCLNIVQGQLRNYYLGYLGVNDCVYYIAIVWFIHSVISLNVLIYSRLQIKPFVPT